MSEYYDDAWYDARWASMPPVMRKVAADALRKQLEDQPELVEQIKRKHAEHGHAWIHYLTDLSDEEIERYRKVGMLGPDQTTWGEHMWWGMSVRNFLRSVEGANIKDEDLPPAPYESGDTHQNWDDYYVQAIEAAVGLRDA